MSFRLRTVIFSAFWLLPLMAQAYSPGAPIVINTGVSTSVPQIFAGLINVLLMWSTLVATALLLVGAVMMVGSAGTDEGAFSVSNGKKIVKAAIIGLAIILGSWMILSTAVYFIAG
jgi:hypothetical protein